MSTDLHETHSGGVVRVVMPPGERYGIVPRTLLEDEQLGLDTRAVAAWLASQSGGYQIVIAALRRKMGMGEDRWARIARELEDAGYLTRACAPSGTRGRWVWHITFNPHPALPGSTVPGSSGYGGSGHGAAEPGQARDRRQQKKEHQSKDNNSKNNNCTQSAKPPASPPQSGEGVRAANGKRVREVLSNGVVLWTEDDVDLYENLLVEFGGDAVAAAATVLSTKGTEPLPSRVARYLRNPPKTQSKKTAWDKPEPVTLIPVDGVNDAVSYF